MQLEDRVTEIGRERSYATGYRSDLFEYRDIRFFLPKNGQVFIYKLGNAEWVLRGKIMCGGSSFSSHLLSNIKLPVELWLYFLRKLPCWLGCGAQKRCVRPDTKRQTWHLFACLKWCLLIANVPCRMCNSLAKKNGWREQYHLLVIYPNIVCAKASVFFDKLDATEVTLVN